MTASTSQPIVGRILHLGLSNFHRAHQVVSVNRFSKDLGPSVYAQGTRAFVKGADGSNLH